VLDVRQKSLAIECENCTLLKNVSGGLIHTVIEVFIGRVEKPMLKHRLAEWSLKGTHTAEEPIDPCVGREMT
jgi:hypothetical protein